MDLTGYQSAKLELAAILRAVLDSAPVKDDNTRHAATELFARLAEDRFNLMVVGRFSRGKSSLMNAILGVDRLPMGILPLTSVITSVGYASEERVVICPEEGTMSYDIPLARLAEYITEQGNPANRRRVRLAQVSLPVELLRRGFYFIDSPGLGSAIGANTRTTRRFLPEADAVMVVSGFEAPLSEEEEQVVRWANVRHLPVFLVLNKQDTVAAQARRQVCGYVRQRLTDLRAGVEPKLFSVSARDGLQAKQSRDEAALADSGIPGLEQELTRFLIEDKGRTFLCGLCERAAELVHVSSATEPARLALCQRLDALKIRVGGARLDSQVRDAPRAFSRSTDLRPAAMSCPLCAWVNERLFDCLSRYQYELECRAEAGEGLARRGGFCAHHMRVYVSLASQRGVCLALTPLLKELLGALRAGTPEAVLGTQPACLLCSLQEEIESEQIDVWLRSTEALLEKGEGICLPHLRSVARRGASQALTALSAHRAEGVERLVEDMQRYVLKRDGIRRELLDPEEQQAAQRGIAFVAAHRVVVTDRELGGTQE